MSDPSRDARTIAAGGNPLFEQTFTHPSLGPLTFRGRLPRAVDSLQHSVELDNQLGALVQEPSAQTMILAAAIAGLTPADPVDAPGKGLLLELPVISEDTTENPERGSEVTRRRFYDAPAEVHHDFLITVWVAYSAWRAKQISDATVSAVGKSSGGPQASSDGSNTPSAAPTGPPSTTPAS